MPIKIPEGLPAVKTLESENIVVITDKNAVAQVKVLVLNLMPKKIETETQLARVLGNTPLVVEMELIHAKSHASKNVSEEHLSAFYKTFYDVKERYFDGMIVTGAPVEHLDFEEVDYWQELCEIMEWAQTHVKSTFYICWGAQAALYYHYGINKKSLSEKKFGVFAHTVEDKSSNLFRGFDDVFFAPHSRHTALEEADIRKVDDLKVLAVSNEAGVYAMSSKNNRQIYVTGHSEYDVETLKTEYLRDLALGKEIAMPVNYFPNNDVSKPPLITWRESGNLLYSNWLNYFVNQTSPYELNEVGNK